MIRNSRAGGGGATRPKQPQQRDDPRRPNLGMPQQGGGRPVYGDPMNGVGQGPRPGSFGPKPGGGFGPKPGGGMGGGRPQPTGGGMQHPGYGPDASYKMLGGQLTVGSKGGGRSWLGAPETEAGSLVPTGMSDNGFMQHGRVPIGNYFNVDPTSQGTPFAREGGDRAGFANNFSWDPQGGANSRAWQGMLGTGGYETYGQPTGVFADRDWGASREQYGIPDPSGQEQYFGAPQRGRTRRTNTFGQVRY